jgi:hypothetical protein
MPEEQEQEWMGFYHAALLEVDVQRLPELIERAHEAIEKRRQELAQTPGQHQAERRALEDASRNLWLLRREMKGQPGERERSGHQ